MPAYIGFQTKSGGSYTSGDLIFGVRDDNTDKAASEVMRLTTDGNATFSGDVAVGGGTTHVSALVVNDSSSGSTIGDSVVLTVVGQNSSAGDCQEIGFVGWTGEGYKPWATIGSRIEDNDSYKKSALTFCTRGATTNTTPTEALRLNSDQSATFAGQVTATGIKFDANGEVLGDYEEGTFTPVFAGTGGTAGDSATTQSLTAHYIKIGALVYWSFGITWTDKGDWTGNVKVTGFPFTCGSAGYPSGSIGYLGGGGDIDMTGFEWFVPRPQPSNTYLALIKHQNGGASQDVTLDNVTLPIFIIASGTYHT